jgi:hypothetical protein
MDFSAPATRMPRLAVIDIRPFARLQDRTIIRANPANYSPLDAFWEKGGYRKAEGMVAMFRWKDIDRHESEHPMQFWMREFA